MNFRKSSIALVLAGSLLCSPFLALAVETPQTSPPSSITQSMLQLIAELTRKVDMLEKALKQMTATVVNVSEGPTSQFTVGDSVTAIRTVNIRSTPAIENNLLSTTQKGAKGVIVGGPVSNGKYVWWQIDYQEGNDGWSIENHISGDVASGRTAGPTQILVKFKNDVPSSDRAQLILEEKLMKKSSINGIGVDVFTVSEDDTTQEVVDRIKGKHKGKIEFVEVDEIVDHTLLPNDPQLSSQWHITKTNTPIAWDHANGTGVIIAIVDTGVNCNHVDLAPSCVPGWNVRLNNSDTKDEHGHGTAVAGTAAAYGNNALGVAGIAYNAKIMPVRITVGTTSDTSFSYIASALTWAADNGADVVNISFKNLYKSSSVKSAAQYFKNKGGLTVVSAGNDALNAGVANTPEMVIVSGTSNSDQMTSFSNWGDMVDIAAPADYILTTNKAGSYSQWRGTSFAAPVVAGAVATVISANPSLTNSQVENVLLSSATDLGSIGWDDHFGWGRVNVGNAVQSALATVGNPVDTISPSAPSNLTATLNTTGSQTTLGWNPSLDNVGVSNYLIHRNGTKVATVSSVNYTDTSISPETVYAYSVTATDATGNVSPSSNSVSVTTPTAPFAITTPYVSGKTGNTAIISWTANRPSTGIVRYGTSAGNLNMSISAGSNGTAHSIAIAGLTKRTTYYYQVVGTETSTGNVVTSPVSSFKTSAK